MLITPTQERVDATLIIPELNQWVDLYLFDGRQQLFKETTIGHYSNALKRFATWYNTQVPEGKIDRRKAKHFAYWLSNVKQKYDDHPGRPTETIRLSPATVRRTIGVVRTFLSWLYRENYLTHDVSRWFVLPRMPKLPKKLIEATTLSALLQGAAQGDMPRRDTALIALLADTGLRQKEVTLLQIEQVCWLDEQGTGYLRYVRGKGDTLRDVPFSPVVGKVLLHWLEQRTQWLERLPTTARLFITEEGGPLRPVSVYQVLRRCAVRAGVVDAVWNTHSLRHNFATHFWRVHHDTKSLSLILGHSGQKSPRTSMYIRIPKTCSRCILPCWQLVRCRPLRQFNPGANLHPSSCCNWRSRKNLTGVDWPSSFRCPMWGFVNWPRGMNYWISTTTCVNSEGR